MTGILAEVALDSVTFFGSVNPDPPGDGDVESALNVGLAGDNNPDFRGYVLIDGGDQIEYDALIVGDDDGYQGELIVRGSIGPGGQSGLRLEEGGSVSNSTVQVGRSGVGRLRIESGGQLSFENSAADLTVGGLATGIGTVTVDGVFSLITIPDRTFIGNGGTGRLEVLDGGMLHNSSLTQTVVLGVLPAGVGSALIDGTGSIWKVDHDLSIGSAKCERLPGPPSLRGRSASRSLPRSRLAGTLLAR